MSNHLIQQKIKEEKKEKSMNKEEGEEEKKISNKRNSLNTIEDKRK